MMYGFRGTMIFHDAMVVILLVEVSLGLLLLLVLGFLYTRRRMRNNTASATLPIEPADNERDYTNHIDLHLETESIIPPPLILQGDTSIMSVFVTGPNKRVLSLTASPDEQVRH